ncbi:ADP-ribosylation factor-binding protein GGA3-like [Gadus macrocephalus]|uniref:ADP-ribosylation factor-binding protein GGA3-like n=1 Tax=Gadus macrocephalus TaxID=80720 RepID=UPI0028CB8084|nr:ADP-ribosylation factor-binding protein GGA3-like [Gadus macrocephalus]
MAGDGESLESWLNKATSSANRQEDWEYIMGFCDQINKELEGPQIATRLLAYKIQSPQEWEAMQTLTVLEACMKNCGGRFHNEVGKFRFLNELIKVVSPKYFGDRISEKVKNKVIEILYSWTVSLPDEAKISEAYQMLKKQGIVSVNPELPHDNTLIPSPSLRPKNPVFENEEKSRRLAELLKSKKPEDLQEANRIIKNMVKEDDVRAQKVTKTNRTLDEVDHRVKLLNEMLNHFSEDVSTDGDKEIIRELYGDCDKLRQTVFKLATETEDNDNNLGNILQASDDLSRVINSYKRIVEGQIINGEKEEHLTRHKAKQSEVLIDLAGLEPQGPAAATSSHLQAPPSSLSVPADLLCAAAAVAPGPQGSFTAASLTLLDEELLFLGIGDPAPVVSQSIVTRPEPLDHQLTSLQDSSQDFDIFGSVSLPAPPSFSTFPVFSTNLSPGPPPAQCPRPSSTSHHSAVFYGSPYTNQSATTVPSLQSSSAATLSPAGRQSYSSTSSLPSYASATSFQTQVTSVPSPHAASTSLSPPGSSNGILQDLDLLDLSSHKTTTGMLDVAGFLGAASTSSSPMPHLLGGMPAGPLVLPPAKSQADDSPLLRSLSPVLTPSQPSPGKGQEISLSSVKVSLEAIKPSKVCPVTAYDKYGIRVLLHFASDCPPDRPDVLVMVASMLNTAPLPVSHIVMQAAVPKSMRLRLQPPSGTELAAFNPILPPAAITQVILLANPLKEKVRMRYKLAFTLGEQPCSEIGEVEQFPPAEKWGAL